MLLVLQNPLDVLFLNIFSFQFLKLVQALGYYNTFQLVSTLSLIRFFCHFTLFKHFEHIFF